MIRIIHWRLCLVASFLGSGLQTVFAQGNKPLVDMYVYTTGKYFNTFDQANANLWIKREHNCSDATEEGLLKMFEPVPKFTQSNLESQAKGGVRLSNQVLTSYEGQMFKNKLLTEKNVLQSVACVLGFDFPKKVLMATDLDYFSVIAAQYRFLVGKQTDKHYFNAKEYKFDILKDGNMLKDIVADPNKSRLGMALSIKGGHTLGYLYEINNKLTNEPDYEKKVLKNVDRLKGLEPLEDNGSEYWKHPILSLSLDGYFDDGLCGKNVTFSENEAKVFGGTKNNDAGFTPLGEKVVKRLTADVGFRVIMDVSGMTPRAREWYYDYLKELRYVEDTIPVLATHSAVNGLDWTENSYQAADNAEKNKDSYFNVYKSALSKQDLNAVRDSEGLLCIPLDERRLITRTKFEALLAKTVPGSAERRELSVKIVVANICKAIHTMQGRSAWDRIAISSEFDEVSNPFDMYSSSSDLSAFAKDLKKYFENPTDLLDIYTAAQVKKYMYDLTPDEIVQKVTSTNAIDFMQKVIGRKLGRHIETASERN